MIVSDQGSNFLSESFKEYCASHGIQQRQSSSYHHQANGQAERAVKDIKKTMVRCDMDNTSFADALLNLRTTPIGPGLDSPAQVLGLDPRTMLPKARYQLNESVIDKLIERKEKMHVPRRTAALQFTVAQQVYVQKETGGPWIEAKIESINPDPHHRGRQYVVRLEATDRLITRNSIHIKPRAATNFGATQGIDAADLKIERRSQRIALKSSK